jgi:hypothetical protein
VALRLISSSRPAVRLFGFLTASVLLASVAVHCSIDHVPHAYCNVDADCDEPPYTSCDTSRHACRIAVDGGVSDDMMLAGPDMFCANSAACSDDAPICSVMRCRACTSGDNFECGQHNPATPVCNEPTGRCVACLTSADCKNPTPVCNTTAFTCNPCTAHSDCTSGVCKADGSCADAADVAYVNNTPGCRDVMHASTPTDTYCQIQYAATSSSKAYLVVHSNATAYNAVNLTATTAAIGPLTIIGPAGRGATAAKATISPTGATVATPAVTVNAAGAAVTVTIDGLDLIGSSAAIPAPGLQCKGAVSSPATVTLKNSTVHDSGQAGVDSSGCTLTLDANVVSANKNEGITVSSATTYVITNNIISGNGASSGIPGVTITDMASTGTFAFNTVATNGGNNTIEGGIACPSTGPTKLIANSIVAQNAHNPMTNGTQFAGKCQLQNVVTGPDTFSGANQAAPAFTADFHLDTTAGAALTANQTCCIDKVPSATSPNANHDVDRGPRPKVPGTALDTGAHEAQ